MMEKGPSALSNAELLAIMIRTGTGKMNVVEVARTLLMKGEGRLNAIADMSLDKLCSVSGIGPGKAVTLAAAFGKPLLTYTKRGAAAACRRIAKRIQGMPVKIDL